MSSDSQAMGTLRWSSSPSPKPKPNPAMEL